MDQTNASLDPRPARKLTSRECAKALGGFLGGCSKVVGVPATLELLRQIAESDEYWNFATSPGDVVAEATAAVAESIPREERNLAAWSLGGAIGGLLTMSSVRAVRTAVRWWAVPGRLEEMKGRVLA